MDKQVTTLKLSQIEIFDNSRKEISEQELVGLQESIKSNGMIQPVIVRIGTGKLPYQLICGQRRFMSAKNLKMEEIPARIMTIPDSEIPGIQLVENLQRADISPMDEAAGFLTMNKTKKIEEISLLVGKPPGYIANRIKLNTLIPEYQKLLKAEKVTLKWAFMICKLGPENQKGLFKSVGGNVQDHNYKHYLGDLLNAPFDTKDTSLNPARGACETCPMNSANQQFLFEEGAKVKKCTDIGCFNLKRKNALPKQIEEAIANPDMVLVAFENGPAVEKLKKQGNQVGVVKEYSYGNRDYDIVESRGAINLDKEVEKGTLKKGLVLDTEKSGTIVYLKKVNTKNSNSKTPASEQKVTAQSISENLKGIQEREKRNKELDFEKVQAEVIKAVEDADKERIKPRKFTVRERGAFILKMLEDCYDHMEIEKFLKIKYEKDDDSDAKVMDTLGKLSQDIFDMICRNWLIDQVNAATSIKNNECYMMRVVATSIGINVPAIQKKQDEVVAGRIDRMNGRIAALKKQLSSISNKKVAPKKKAAAKKKK